MEMLIRKAEAGDMETMLSLLEQQYLIHNAFYPNFYHAWSDKLKEDMRAFLEKIIGVKVLGALVAVVDDKIVGLLTYAVNGRGHPDTIVQEFLDVTELIVDSSVRSKGIGAELISEVKSIGRELGIKTLRVAVSSKNTKGIAFYEKNGFDIREVTAYQEI